MAIENVKINPMYVYLGVDTAQVQKITCVAGTLLGGKYFLFHDAAGAKHYAWFNTGSSVDPAPAGGWNGHEVAVLVGDSAAQVATKLAAILTAVTGFDATATGSIVELVHTAMGYAQPARDGNTLFSFKVTTLGWTKVSAGCVQGDIEITGFEQQKVEVTCHASGTTVKNEIISGYTKPELSLTLQETDKETLKKIMVMYGMGTFTPVGADQVEVFGYGPANVGGSNPKIRISLEPVNPSGGMGDKSENLTIWKAELGLDTFNFSGENISVIPAKFSIYPDESKQPKSIQFYFVGDAEKAGY